MPERPVLWRVSTGGHLEVEWLDRISHFSDDNFVELSWRAERRGEGVVRGLVSAVILDHLHLGALYQANLTDLITNQTEHFSFMACK